MENKVVCIPAASLSSEHKAVTNVAAYCRVSSLPQEESYESQVEHFTSYIRGHDDWTLTKVYGDEGCSGLNTIKRGGFKQMLKDGKSGKFDLLLVKSISRLGRNTVDLLQCIRALKSAGVVCFFEKENLSTDGNGTGELMLTLLSAFAQMESESISANVRIGLNYKMQRGEWSCAYSTFLGYDNVDGEIAVNLEQTETVRLIFDLFLSGFSLAQITKRLESSGRTTGMGNKTWHKGTIERILQNRKYCGDVVLQLTVTEDVLTKRRVPNDGLAPQYIVYGGIPAIITKQTFWLAQGELERRGRLIHHQTKGSKGIDVTRYDNGFTGKLKCGCCGANYNKVNTRRSYSWKCRQRISGECDNTIIPEAEVQKVVLLAAQELYDRQPSLRLKGVETLSEESTLEELVSAAEAHIANQFKKRVIDFLKGDKPEKFSMDLLEIIERIDYKKGFRVSFYDGSIISIPRQKVTVENIPISTLTNETEESSYFAVTGEPRKRLVRRLSSLTGKKSRYLGYPSCAYEIGDLRVLLDGTVEGRLSKKVLQGLERSGFVPVEKEDQEKTEP